MGRTGSSSKRKSSIKKSSKISSKARSRKKIRRDKSNKLSRRRHDSTSSFSSYSDDESISAVSVSSFGSEDDYKSRKPRSRGRSRVKSSRKRGRSISSSRESSEDSPRVRKRKASKKIRSSELRKRSQKKKPRRDSSVSYTSSDSRSCSTCRGSSTSDGDSDFRRLRGRSRQNKNAKKDLGKVRTVNTYPEKFESGTKKKRNRSGSRSSCRGGIGDDSMEKVAGEINSRRLRSVITVAKQAQENEGIEQDKNEHKEEIVYDHDDYPSSRSNDSNDDRNKKDLVHLSRVESEKRRNVGNITGEDSAVYGLKAIETATNGKDDSGQLGGISPRFEGVETSNNPKMKSESDGYATVAGSSGENLESILRQKALENLRRFKGAVQTNAKYPVDEESKGVCNQKQLSTAKPESIRNKSTDLDESKVSGATHLADQSRMPTWRRASSGSSAISCNLKVKEPSDRHTADCNSESSISAVKQEYSDTGPVAKQAPTSQASPKSTLVVTKGVVNRGVDETSRIKAKGMVNGIAAETPQTAVESNSNSSREKQGEVQDSSQFQQKTYTEKKGGETVQVKYQVYIPPNNRALARRRLQQQNDASSNI